MFQTRSKGHNNKQKQQKVHTACFTPHTWSRYEASHVNSGARRARKQLNDLRQGTRVVNPSSKTSQDGPRSTGCLGVKIGGAARKHGESAGEQERVQKGASSTSPRLRQTWASGTADATGLTSSWRARCPQTALETVAERVLSPAPGVGNSPQRSRLGKRRQTTKPWVY